MSGVKFTLYLSEEQNQYLEQKAKAEGMTKNAYLKNLLQSEARADQQDRLLSEILAIKELLEKSK